MIHKENMADLKPWLKLFWAEIKEKEKIGKVC